MLGARRSRRRCYHKDHCHLIRLKEGLDAAAAVMGAWRVVVSIVVVHTDGQTGGSMDLGQQQVGVTGEVLNDAEIAAVGSEQEFQIYKEL